LRPLSGRSAICCSLTSPPSVLFSVFTSGASPVTVTSCCVVSDFHGEVHHLVVANVQRQTLARLRLEATMLDGNVVVAYRKRGCEIFSVGAAHHSADLCRIHIANGHIRARHDCAG